MYATTNFQTKQALRDAVKRGDNVGVYNPDIISDRKYKEGPVFICGPKEPAAVSWYANVELRQGQIIWVD